MVRKEKNYRKKFEKAYDIKVPKGYDIHHIDLNHENNDIENLVLLPSKLHNKYHFLINATATLYADMPFEKTFNAQIHSTMFGGDNYNLIMSMELIKTLQECNKWYDYKLFLQGEIPNIHNITL